MSKIIDLDVKSYGRKYYDSGALKSEILQIGKQQILQIYFEDGSLQATSPTINFKLNGKAIVYYRNGNIHCKINYLNHQQDGLAQGYYYNGKKAIEILYKRDKAKIGVYYKKSGFKQTMSEEQLKRKSKL